VLVTGGTGFLGQMLIRRLKQLNVDVIGTTRWRDGDQPNNSDYLDFDLADSGEKMREMLKGFDVLVHLGWSSTPSQSNKQPAIDFTHNAGGTVRLFQQSAESNIRRVIFASSGGQVYGNAEASYIDETTQTDPTSVYGIGKLSCEKYLTLLEKLYGLIGISLRVSNLYGPGQIPREGFGVIPTFLKRIQENEPIVIYGDGSVIRDFIFIDDVIEAFVASIFSQQTGVCNISSGTGESILDIVRKIEALLGRNARIEFQPARASDPARVVLKNELALKKLGWRPTVEFNEGLGRTVQNFLRG